MHNQFLTTLHCLPLKFSQQILKDLLFDGNAPSPFIEFGELFIEFVLLDLLVKFDFLVVVSF